MSCMPTVLSERLLYRVGPGTTHWWPISPDPSSRISFHPVHQDYSPRTCTYSQGEAGWNIFGRLNPRVSSRQNHVGPTRQSGCFYHLDLSPAQLGNPCWATNGKNRRFILNHDDLVQLGRLGCWFDSAHHISFQEFLVDQFFHDYVCRRAVEPLIYKLVGPVDTSRLGNFLESFKLLKGEYVGGT